MSDPRINLFFRNGTVAGGAASTWRRYAYALVVWLEFLEVSGRRWGQATARDVEALKHWRLTDLRNSGRVQPTSFDTDRAAINVFYTGRGHLRTKVAPSGGAAVVTGCGLPARAVGLRGYGFDGLRRPGWRGQCEDRDVAFVEGLYGTGLRLREWASILDVELPAATGGRMARAWLAAACIKGGGEGRRYYL